MKYLGLIMFAMFSVLCVAQATTPPPVTDGDLFSAILAAFTSLKGASTLVIIAAIVQLILKFLNSTLFDQWFSKLDGHIKLLLISGMTVVGSVVGMMSQGVSFWMSITSGAILTSIMVFVNQLIVQFTAPKSA